MIEKLSELEKESKERGIPIIGPEKGAWLLQKVKELKPKKILELGCANGYSGCILGSAGGVLTTIEQDDKIAMEAMQNFSKFDVNAEVILGDGAQIVKELSGSFDLIFIDFSKKNYLKVLEDCIRLCNVSSVIVADNISMSGCADFREKVLSDSRLKTEIVDIKDGLSYSVVVSK
jgi:predicted O-methyltransferase YrrM